MSDTLIDHDALIYREMMTHIPLFTHRKPQNVAIFDDGNRGLIEEVLKHDTVTTVWHIGNSQNKLSGDSRIKHVDGTLQDFLVQTEKNALDILIIGSTTPVEFKHCLNALHIDGIFIQLCESSYNLTALKSLHQPLKSAGFADIMPIHFFQPNFVSGSRAAVVASKDGTIKRPREKDIYNKKFTTVYYNLDMHKAAFALPEFMREELELVMG